MHKSSSWESNHRVFSEFAPLNPVLQGLLDELAVSLNQGRPVTAAELLKKHAELNSEEAVLLIYEEFCLKRDEGVEVDSSEVLRQFPQYHNQLATLLGFDRLLDTRPASIVFPEAGEEIGPFLLISKLGQGAAGQTFLARERSLGDRLVVVKIVPDDQEEHLALARLQHTHIMPLYSEFAVAGLGLRLLCMPYLGGAGLNDILARVEPKELAKLSGRDFLNALDTLATTDFARDDTAGPSRQFHLKCNYADTIATIGASLAEAAHEAHARGLVHMDIKPSNVLISADAEPLLLDFHLARKPVQQGGTATERLGGTRGWMSPEQDRCFQAARQGLPMPCAIDGRSDQFSIGLLMADALKLKFSRDDHSLKNRNGVPLGLADIIRRCLAENPTDRYSSAALLADDLRRHLANLPLKGVKNRSLAERWLKWKKRNPAGPVWLLAAAALVPLVTYAGYQALQLRGLALEEAADQIKNSRRWIETGEYETAIERLNATRLNIAGIPGNSYHLRQLDQNLAQARRLKLASQLNFVMDRVRFQCGPADLPDPARDKLKEQCLSLWDRRQELIQNDSQIESEFNQSINDKIKADLIELAVIISDLIVRESKPGSAQAARNVINEAEKELGPDFSLSLARAGLSEPAQALKPFIVGENQTGIKNAREFHQWGQFLARQKRLADARQAFLQATSLQPDQFWFQYDLAVCLHQLKRFEEAVAAWSAAIATRPNSAVCRYNRGLTWESLKQPELALADFNFATYLEPTLADAWLRAGLLLNESGKKAEALDSLEKAAEHATDRSFKARVYFRESLIYNDMKQPEQARTAAEKATSLGSVEAARWLRANSN